MHRICYGIDHTYESDLERKANGLSVRGETETADDTVLAANTKKINAAMAWIETGGPRPSADPTTTINTAPKKLATNHAPTTFIPPGYNPSAIPYGPRASNMISDDTHYPMSGASSAINHVPYGDTDGDFLDRFDDNGMHFSSLYGDVNTTQKD